MNGGLTYRDMEDRLRKANAFDEALAYLSGRASSEEGVYVQRILGRAVRSGDIAAPPVAPE